MTEGYYRYFAALEEVSIKIIRELRNKPIEARLYLKSYIQGEHDLIVIRPRISSEVPSTLSQLSASLERGPSEWHQGLRAATTRCCPRSRASVANRDLEKRQSDSDYPLCRHQRLA